MIAATSPVLIDPSAAGTAAAPLPGTTTQPAKRVYQTLDAWRGIASLWVVIYHASEFAVHSKPSLQSAWLYRIGLFGSLGVQIFFVISGYCIASSACSTANRGKSWLSFGRARLMRIFPTMWAALALFVAFYAAGNIMAARGSWSPNHVLPDLTHQSGSYWVANITLLQPMLHQKYLAGVCWTLSYEVAFYGVVALTLATLGRNGRTTRMLYSMHMLTISCLLIQTVWPLAIRYPLDMWAQFGYGVFAYHLISVPRRRATLVLAFIAVLLTVVLICTRTLPIGLLAVPCGPTFGTSLVIAIVLVAIYPHDSTIAHFLPVRWLSLVGIISYSLYLTHFLSLVSTTIFFKATELDAYIHTRFVVSVLVAIAIASIFFQVVERWFATTSNVTNAKLPDLKYSCAASPITFNAPNDMNLIKRGRSISDERYNHDCNNP
jgi:exopolysaccharide production protein ExoZ